MRTQSRCRLSSAVAVAMVFVTSATVACSVPVFRYALEHWRPDPYEVLVYHRGELSAEQETQLSRLTPEYVPGEPLSNAAVSRIDLDGNVRPEFAAIWAAHRSETLPWIVVRTPWKGENETVWQGPVNGESIETIQRSPLRSELVKRLAEGDSVVWVLLEGQDAAANDRLAQQITGQLAQLQGGIRLPEIQAEDLSSLSVAPDKLGLRFSLLRMHRDDPQENLLLKTLMTVKPGLDAPELSGEAMLFPVFGRGRVYFPLVGSAIEPANLEDLARFLSGACQCTIKQQNPGVDLLTTVDWDAYVLGIETEKPLPPLAGLGGFVTTATAAESPPSSTDHGTQEQAPPLNSPPGAVDDDSGRSTSSERESPPVDAKANSAAPISTSPPPNEGSQTAALGSQVFWVIGLVTAVVVIASLTLIPRRPI